MCTPPSLSYNPTPLMPIPTLLRLRCLAGPLLLSLEFEHSNHCINYNELFAPGKGFYQCSCLPMQRSDHQSYEDGCDVTTQELHSAEFPSIIQPLDIGFVIVVHGQPRCSCERVCASFI